MEGCERCTLYPSFDGHWFHVCIFLLTKVITKRKLILDMRFPFLQVELKLKIVKDVYCPILFNCAGLMSLSPADESYYKNEVILDMQFSFLPVGVKLKVVKMYTVRFY